MNVMFHREVKAMKPFSAIYYMRENKTKTAICVFVIVLTAGLFMLGNFIWSMPLSYATDFLYNDQFVLVSATTADTADFADYAAFLEDVKNDPHLKYLERSARGFTNLQYTTAIGLKTGTFNYICNSVDDLKKMFAHLDIECDYSALKHRSIILSKRFAANRGIKLGDTLDRSFDAYLEGSYTVDALIDSDAYTCFYVVEDNENLLRLYIYSDEMQGRQLHEYVEKLAGDKKIQISPSMRDAIIPQFRMFFVLFYTVTFFISVIMAVTVNSVLTGHYLKRSYEFGIYRALGRSRREVFAKCAAEILCMDALAVLIGLTVQLLASYLLNELCFKPNGIFLPYLSTPAVLGYTLCNVLIVVPLVLSKGRMCCRADVTEF